jgi:hypothetical protein
MHRPAAPVRRPSGHNDEQDPKPPVPPDQAPDVVPQEEPPKPGRDRKDPPLVAEAFEREARHAVEGSRRQGATENVTPGRSPA